MDQFAAFARSNRPEVEIVDVTLDQSLDLEFDLPPILGHVASTTLGVVWSTSGLP